MTFYFWMPSLHDTVPRGRTGELVHFVYGSVPGAWHNAWHTVGVLNKSLLDKWTAGKQVAPKQFSIMCPPHNNNISTKHLSFNFIHPVFFYQIASWVCTWPKRWRVSEGDSLRACSDRAACRAARPTLSPSLGDNAATELPGSALIGPCHQNDPLFRAGFIPASPPPFPPFPPQHPPPPPAASST